MLLRIFLIIFFIVLDCSAAQPPKFQLDGIGPLAEQKTMAEDLGRLLKQHKNKNKITKEAFQDSELLYIDARSAIDGWIELAETSLQTGTTTFDSKAQESALRVALAKSFDFTQNAKQLLQGKAWKRGDGPMISIDVEKIISTLMDTIKEVLSNKAKEKQKQDDELIQKLERLKWKEFNEI